LPACWPIAATRFLGWRRESGISAWRPGWSVRLPPRPKANHDRCRANSFLFPC
jgi:hypothetical protein